MFFYFNLLNKTWCKTTWLLIPLIHPIATEIWSIYSSACDFLDTWNIFFWKGLFRFIVKLTPRDERYRLKHQNRKYRCNLKISVLRYRYSGTHPCIEKPIFGMLNPMALMIIVNFRALNFPNSPNYFFPFQIMILLSFTYILEDLDPG